MKSNTSMVLRGMPKRRTTTLLVALCLVVAFIGCKHEPLFAPVVDGGGNGGNGGGDDPINPCDPNLVYFEQQVLPILISNCAVPGCHNLPTDDNGGRQITSYSTLMNSDIIDMNDPFGSDFWEDINDSDPDDRMPRPPQNPLTQGQLDLIERWLQQGAQNNSCAETACDTLNVTYSGTIAPLVAQRCAGCHGGGTPQGGLNFGSWSVLNSVAADGRLADAIQHVPGAPAMPPTGAMLPDCRIQQFLIWIDSGAPNN
ncbi:MAG TPA: cytochrome c [Flavobacteriales bacterium]|nr:cytochrome c [Flavobacteriales bacterium]HQW41900.1 cytochrome c [Flavobacteriales bacterium]